MRTFPLRLLTAVAVASATPASARQATFQGLGDLPGGHTFSQAFGVSPDGSVVVGESYSGPCCVQDAFRWESGLISNLNDLPGLAAPSAARGASVGGSIVVGWGMTDTGANGSEAVRIIGGTVFPMGTLPGGRFPSVAAAVSANGSVVAGYAPNSNSRTEAFRWTNGTMSGLGFVPGREGRSEATGVSADGSVIVGWSGVTATSSSDREAFHWSEATGMRGLGDLPGAPFRSQANAVSSDGRVIVGYGCTSNGPSNYCYALRWLDGSMEDLGSPFPPFSSNALAASGDGSRIVGSAFDGQRSLAFLWVEGQGMFNLEQLLSETYLLNLSGWKLEMATGISSDGSTIVGRGFNPSGYQEAWISVLPSHCSDTFDNDADGLVDISDPGCEDPEDDSERGAPLPCDDGIDNETNPDGLVDLADPGCATPTWPLEDPLCQNGFDDDFDGGIDFDGGALAGNPTGVPDVHCVGKPWRNKEVAARCGLGFELAFLLPLMMRASHRLFGRVKNGE